MSSSVAPRAVNALAPPPALYFQAPPAAALLFHLVLLTPVLQCWTSFCLLFLLLLPQCGSSSKLCSCSLLLLLLPLNCLLQCRSSNTNFSSTYSYSVLLLQLPLTPVPPVRLLQHLVIQLLILLLAPADLCPVPVLQHPVLQLLFLLSMTPVPPVGFSSTLCFRSSSCSLLQLPCAHWWSSSTLCFSSFLIAPAPLNPCPPVRLLQHHLIQLLLLILAPAPINPCSPLGSP